MLTADLRDQCGIDVWDRDLMRSRNWGWLRDAIYGLLATPAAGYLKVPVDDTHMQWQPYWRTRIQNDLFTPTDTSAAADADWG